MFPNKIDYDKLHGELREVMKRQQELAPQVQKGWRNSSMGELKAEFDALSTRMTVLCCILNHSKGRLHLIKLTKAHGYYPGILRHGCADPVPEFTLEHQVKLIGDEWLAFVKPEAVEEAEVEEVKVSVSQ